MVKHTAQSLSSHLAASWSTAEKRKQQPLNLSLAAEILNLDTTNQHIPARLIALLTSHGANEAILQTIKPFLGSDTARENWPLAIATASIPKSLLLDHIPSVIDPLDGLVDRLSSLSLSSSVLRDDLSLATPLELVSLSLRAHEKCTVDNQRTVELIPTRQRPHYIPVTDKPEVFDYLVELGLKEPPTPPAPSRSTPPTRKPASVSRPSPLQLANVNLHGLKKLGKHGPIAAPPDISRMRLNSNSYSVNLGASNSTLQEPTGSAPIPRRRRSFPQSSQPVDVDGLTGTGYATTTSISPVQNTNDDEVEFVGVTPATKPNASLDAFASEDDVAAHSVQQHSSGYSISEPSTPLTPSRGPTLDKIRAKLSAQRRAERQKMIPVDVDRQAVESDTAFARNQKRKERELEKADRARQIRERAAAREASKKRVKERKRKRIGLSKGISRVTGDDFEDENPTSKEEDVIAIDDDSDKRRRTGDEITDNQRRLTRSLSRGTSNDSISLTHKPLSASEVYEEKRSRLFGAIRGHMHDLTNKDRRTIEDFLQGNNDMFGMQPNLLILLHHDCDGADHYIRLTKMPRHLEEVKIHSA